LIFLLSGQIATFGIMLFKIVWIKIGNVKKNIFFRFVESIYNEVEEMLLYSSFVIVNEDKIEGF